jgi:hypothetical protein
MENAKNFSIYTCLPDVIKIYNENIHSSIKFRPSEVFIKTDTNIIKKVIDNIKKSQHKFKDRIEGFKINTKCLLCENYILKGNNIKYRKLKKRKIYYTMYNNRK